MRVVVRVGMRAKVRVRSGSRQGDCEGEGKGVRVAVGARPPALSVWSAWQQEHAR